MWCRTARDREAQGARSCRRRRHRGHSHRQTPQHPCPLRRCLGSGAGCGGSPCARGSSVTALAVAPRSPALLASCGADGRLVLSHARAPGVPPEPILILDLANGKDSGADDAASGCVAAYVAWSPTRPCLLAASSPRGGVSFVDLFKSTDSRDCERVQSPHNAAAATALAFHPMRGDLLAVGDVAGSIALLRLPPRLASEQRGEARALTLWLRG